MGLLDKARELLGKHDDKVDQAIDKVGEVAKEKFQGHEEQIDKVTQMGKDYNFSGGEPAAEAEPPVEEQPPAQ